MGNEASHEETNQLDNRIHLIYHFDQFNNHHFHFNDCRHQHFNEANTEVNSSSTGAMHFTNPTEIAIAYTVDEVRGVLERVQQWTDAGSYAAGFVTYEASPAFDEAYVVRSDELSLSNSQPLPLVWFGRFAGPSSGDFESKSEMQVNESCRYTLQDWKSEVDEREYEQAITQIHAAIAGGETYQVNYTFRLSTMFSGDSYAYYKTLRAVQQGAYSAYLNINSHQILSLSPEMFFHREGRHLVTRPMKGTMPRGRHPQADNENRRILEQSAKDQAENVMIVDLLRNDMGRMAKTGSVHVDQLFAIETYPTVFQMTSTISAELEEDATLLEIFDALFPCGSITGAPKISTMRHIKTLESSPRGIYCGAIGFAAPNGRATFNVAIRTVTLDAVSGQASYGTGGGITWDSSARSEFHEALAKTAILHEQRDPFHLLETILWERGTGYLLDLHINRLVASAQYFSIPVTHDKILDAVQAYTGHLPLQGTLRLRLLVSDEAVVYIEHSTILNEIRSENPKKMNVAIASSSISSQDVFLYHKTTNRAVYEQFLSEHPDVFDVLLWNERGELTEFTIGNLVIEQGETKWTPPISSGLLAGTFREHLLKEGTIQERVLTREDLAQAEHIWLINSVRQWVPVEFIDD